MVEEETNSMAKALPHRVRGAAQILESPTQMDELMPDDASDPARACG